MVRIACSLFGIRTINSILIKQFKNERINTRTLFYSLRRLLICELASETYACYGQYCIYAL